MVKINVIISLFVLEIVADLLLLRVFKIKYNLLYVVFLQLPKICINVLCLEIVNEIWLKILLYFIVNILTIIFITDSFSLKRMICLLVTQKAFLCSVIGFMSFIFLWLDSSLKTMTSMSINKNYYFAIIVFTVMYIFVIYKIIRYLEKNKTNKQFLADVSFFIMGEHIKVYGLIDSGNSISDPLTKKPIIILSEISLKKALSESVVEKFKQGKFFELKCETISSETVIPIYKCGDVKIRNGKNITYRSCLIGLVNKCFEGGKYDCLLPRDLI